MSYFLLACKFPHSFWHGVLYNCSWKTWLLKPFYYKFFTLSDLTLHTIIIVVSDFLDTSWPTVRIHTCLASGSIPIHVYKSFMLGNWMGNLFWFVYRKQYPWISHIRVWKCWGDFSLMCGDNFIMYKIRTQNPAAQQDSKSRIVVIQHDLAWWVIIVITLLCSYHCFCSNLELCYCTCRCWKSITYSCIQFFFWNTWVTCDRGSMRVVPWCIVQISSIDLSPSSLLSFIYCCYVSLFIG